MQLYVAVFFLLAASWTQDTQAAQCSLDVVNRVMEIYQKYQRVPNSIIARNIQLSPDVVVYTTDGYFSDQDNIQCISTSWSQGGTFTSTIVYKNGTSSVSSQTVIELPGQTYSPVTTTHRYHIPTDGLVAAFYSCTNNGEAGPAAGVVKVWNGYDEEDLSTAKEDLEYVLDTSLSQTFVTICNV